MRFASIASGSRGNALLVQSARACILLDCGISFRQLVAGLDRLGLSLADLQAVFITHEHGDHIKGVRALCRKSDLPVYMTRGTAAAADYLSLPQLRCLDGFAAVSIGDLCVQPVVVPHDAREPCQFVVTEKNSAGDKSLGVLTDLGSYTPHVAAAYRNCDALELEFNHDVALLQGGPYPPSLKQRVLGDWGHLSNRQAGDLLMQFDRDKLQWLVVAHISQQNNSQAQVEAVLQQVFPYPERFCLADQDDGFPWLEVA